MIEELFKKDDRYASDKIAYFLEEFKGKKYIIFFTPRTGSSYLSRLIKNIGSLGVPEEWFNPEVVENIVKKYNINSSYEYVHYIFDNFKSSNNVFGIEITNVQISPIRKIMNFNEFISSSNHFFFLYRDNFVLQAISMYKAIATNIFHSYTTKIVENEYYDSKLEYNPDGIKSWINQILEMEYGIYKLMKEYQISTFNFTYESLISSTEIVINGIANIIGENITDKKYLYMGNHQKLPLGLTVDFYQKFVQQEINFINDCIDKRKETTGIDSFFIINLV
ncbi:MAG: hypothetical protein K9G67_12425 [Bacteroidales bacterium]|nr:hypothetical protein [Bacteroidales bacterium]MCF8350612.1 hypothetical protein [Bacteroidales bacterium]MCF8377155.1 hypothetical protein [Bacteroidales bacterium]